MGSELMKRRSFITTTGAVTAGAAVALAGKANGQMMGAGNMMQSGEKMMMMPADSSVAGGWMMHQAAKPNDLTELEMKHIPDIFIDGKSVRVRCKHPMLMDHFIQKIQLMSGDRELGVAFFTPEVTDPEATFSLTMEGKVPLKAISTCNKHGVYIGEKMADI